MEDPDLKEEMFSFVHLEHWILRQKGLVSQMVCWAPTKPINSMSKETESKRRRNRPLVQFYGLAMIKNEKYQAWHFIYKSK